MRGHHNYTRANMYLATVDSEVEMSLKRAWPTITRMTRIVLYLAIVKGLYNKEIAEVLNIKMNTVMRHMYLSRQATGCKSQRLVYAYCAIRYFQERSKTDGCCIDKVAETS